MAITLDPATFVLSIPQADLTLISGTIYKADTEAIRLELKALEASVAYMGLPKMLNHNTTVTLFGVTYARSIEILSPYSITFTPDSQWSVRLDGSNNNYGDVAAGILNQNQVQVIPTNSAGLQDLSTMLAAAYQGQVIVNTITGQAGTSTPIGTYTVPSSNMPDALTIAQNEGLNKIILAEDITTYEDFTDRAYTIIGTSPYVTLNANVAANLTGVALNYLTVIGELDGLNVIRECSIQAVTNVSGFIEKCAFLSTVSFNDDMLIMECYSNVSGGGYPTFTRTVAGKTLEVRDWHGSIAVEGITDGDHTIGGSGGRVVIGSTCTGGNIHIRKAWFEIVDNSGPGCTVYDEREVAAIWNAQTTDYTEVGSMGLKQGEAAAGSDVDAIWDEPTSNHQIPGSTGKALSDAGGAVNPWSLLLDGNNFWLSIANYFCRKLRNYY